MNTRNNILFITSDQQHWFTLGQQNPEIHTPNLDRLAAAGCTFNRAYTVNANTGHLPDGDVSFTTRSLFTGH